MLVLVVRGFIHLSSFLDIPTDAVSTTELCDQGRSTSAVIQMDPTSSTGLSNWHLNVRFDDDQQCQYHDLGEGIEQCWKRVGKLGEGTCGKVWKEQCLSDTAGPSAVFRAVKQIAKRRSIFATNSEREIKALTTFSNPNVEEVSNVATTPPLDTEFKRTIV